MVISIPDVSVTLDQMMAILVNDVPTEDVGLKASIENNGPVAAVYAYLETKHGNKQLVSASVQMQLVEYGTFEANLGRAKDSLMKDFSMDGEDVAKFLKMLRTRMVQFFPELEEKQHVD